MLRFATHTETRCLPTAIWLGAIAFFINMALCSLTEPHFLPVGNILVFLSSLAFGAIGGLTSALIAMLPEIVATHDPIGIRAILLATAIGCGSVRLPRIPGFVVAALLWLLVFAPLQFWGAPLFPSLAHLSILQLQSAISTSALGETMLALVAGALLLNRDVWGLLTQRPRQVRMPDLLLHVIPLVTSLVVLVTLALARGTLYALDSTQFVGGAYGLIGLLAVTILLPALIGLRLAALIARDFQELLRTGIICPGQTFSGLASDFWRRHSATDIRNPLSSTTTQNYNTTEGDLANATSTAFSAPEQGLCALNRNGTVAFVNRKFKSLCALALNDVIGKRLDSLTMEPNLRAQILLLVEDTFKKGPRVAEVRVNELPAKLRFFELSTTRSDAFENSSLANGPDSVIVTIKEITERRTVETHLLQGQKLDSLGTLMAGVTHAFNNALTAIAGESSTARYQSERTQVDEALTRILKCTRDAAALVKKLNQFAVSQPGLMKVEPFGDLLREKLSLIRQVIGGSCEIQLSLPAETLGVSCDANLITQALTNLLLNAKEAYSDASGKIELSLETETIDEDVSFLHLGARPGRYVRLKVKDQGIGMNRETLAHAFDPLFTTKKEHGHAGLGLSIVFAVMHAHDGFLTAESQLGKGTTVSLYFPLRDCAPSSIETEAAVEAAALLELPHGAQQKVLVIEDDPAVCALVSRMLHSLDYHPVAFTDVEEAIACSPTEQFKVALVDMMMPKMMGDEAINRLRLKIPDAAFILMTGSPSERHLASDEVLVKPFELDTLARKVHRVMQGVAD